MNTVLEELLLRAVLFLAASMLIASLLNRISRWIRWFRENKQSPAPGGLRL